MSNKYPNGKLEYNLKGSHPVGTNLGLGRFVRRNFQERPCITPVFYKSNPVRNFSISTCHSLRLREAHKEVKERVSSVRIGSWFHEAGSDHRILFGNASIRIGARAFVYGTQTGTYRLLFPTLMDNHLSVTHYLHKLMIYKILNDTCHDKHSTKSCEELFSKHQIEAHNMTMTVRLWLPKKKKFERFAKVEGLETTLRAGIHKPWSTVFQSVGPLLTTELIEEVEGRGLYSHISSEERKEDLPGLLYLESRRCGLFLWLIMLILSGAILLVQKRLRTRAEHDPESQTESVSAANDSSALFKTHHGTSPLTQGTTSSDLDEETGQHFRP
ncbi:hypothetical protein FGB62_94g048 [Gracilaria domingensis]|nr:hypothetical protein FGB62_94g048 [Gracilaria domingensis]